MSLSDKALGSILLAAAIVIFLYYTIWVMILPFAQPDHPIFEYFPHQEYAIAVPCVLLVGVLVVTGVFIGSVIVKESGKKKKK